MAGLYGGVVAKFEEAAIRESILQRVESITASSLLFRFLVAMYAYSGLVNAYLVLLPLLYIYYIYYITILYNSFLQCDIMLSLLLLSSLLGLTYKRDTISWKC